MRSAASHSLRRRLLVSVTVAILLGALLQGFSAYRAALAQADTLFDYHLRQMANSLLGGPALPSSPRDNLAADDTDYVIQIWSADGRHVFQSSRIVLPPRAVLGFADVTQNNVRYRVFSLQTPLQTIQIAQNMDDRLARARGLALRSLLPLALIAPLLVLALWWIISRSLRPLERTRQQVAARAAEDLTPLPDDGLPEEVQPLVQEINLLFGRLHASFDAQRAFVANAAHELRSPLTALKLQAQVLGRTSDPQARELAVTRLNQGVDRAIRLMQQLLELARHESAGPQADAAQRIDLAPLLAQAVQESMPQALEKSIALEFVHADGCPINGNGDSLLILLRNLLDNAIKYTPAQGRVRVCLHTSAHAVQLTVEDSGPGIAPPLRDKMFERFARGPDLQADGSGLGLSIASAIARRHEATLRLEQSQELGGLAVVLGFRA